jgi:hypothetical protein
MRSAQRSAARACLRHAVAHGAQQRVAVQQQRAAAVRRAKQVGEAEVRHRGAAAAHSRRARGRRARARGRARGAEGVATPLPLCQALRRRACGAARRRWCARIKVRPSLYQRYNGSWCQNSDASRYAAVSRPEGVHACTRQLHASSAWEQR